MAKHNDTGQLGEELAARFLVGMGYVIRDRQWSHKKLELDIVAENEELVIIVEVKTRSSDKFGNPEEAVNEIKEKRLLDATEAYIIENEIDKDIRIDILSVILSDPPEIRHLEGAIIPELE